MEDLFYVLYVRWWLVVWQKEMTVEWIGVVSLEEQYCMRGIFV
jgi:hypothetical protein